MALSRTYPAGWALGDLLTTAQQNAIDIAITNAADKRVAAVDQIGAIWQMVQPGRIVQSTFLAPDMTAILASGDSPGTDMRLTSGVTANRSYYLGSGSTARNGDRFLVWCDATFLYEASVYDQDSNVLLYVVGNKSSSDGNWAEFFFNGTAWVLTRDGHGNRLQSMDFTSYGEIVVPRGVFLMMVMMWGGGGAGGQPIAPPTMFTNQRMVGGPGGAASQLVFSIIPVTPGLNLGVQPGSGGAPVGGGAPVPGGSGGDTTITATVSGTTIARAKGAAGAPVWNGLTGADANTLIFVPGASGPGSSTQTSGYSSTLTFGTPPVYQGYGNGGASLATANDDTNRSYAGVASIQGFLGGASGATGATSGSYKGGAGGGGGGGGPGGTGGAGGAGGAANSGAVAASGSPGSNGVANSGGGGGGGGGPGFGMTSGANGGAGGAGGSGRAQLFWVK